MQRPLKWYDYITININYFALTARSQTLGPLVVPLLIQQFMGEDVKGATYGTIRLWALMAGLLAQAFFGIISDRTRTRWGRRRIYVVIGTLSEVVVILAMGLLAGLEGATGFWLLLLLYILSMITSNISNAATLGFIPDLVPESKRGLASGIKALLELPLPLVFVSLVIGEMISKGQMMPSLVVLVVIMVICMGITLLVKEEAFAGEDKPISWKPLVRLTVMTGLFAAVILGTGAAVKAVLPLAASLAAPGKYLLAGAAGLAGMAVAVVVGVPLGMRAGMGPEAGSNWSYTWWVVNRLASLVASTNLAGFMLYFLQEKFPALKGEKSAGPAANIILVVGVFNLFAAVPSGWLADKVGKKLLIAVSGLLGALGTLVVVLAGDMTLIYVGGCVIGAGVGLFYSASWALGTELVPRERAGAFLGLSNLAGAGAGAVGAYIGGPIADQLSYVLLMSIYGLLFLLSNIPLLWVKEPRPAKTQAGV